VTGFFVDSNLLLYFVDPTEPRKRTRAAEWLEALWAAAPGGSSWQVPKEFCWNALKKMRLRPAKARKIVEDLSHCGPVSNSLGIGQDACRWMDMAQVPYWTRSFSQRRGVPDPGTCFRKISQPVGGTKTSRC